MEMREQAHACFQELQKFPPNMWIDIIQVYIDRAYSKGYSDAHYVSLRAKGYNEDDVYRPETVANNLKKNDDRITEKIIRQFSFKERMKYFFRKISLAKLKGNK